MDEQITAMPPQDPETEKPVVAAEPVAQPVVAAEPVAQPVVVAEPVAQPVVVAEPVAQPVVAAEPVAQPVVVAEPVAQPVVAAQPVAQPVVAAQPVAQPVVAAQSVAVAEPVAQPAPVFCSGCGTKIPDGMKFCPNCGKPANAPAVAASSKKSRKIIPLTVAAVALIAIAIVACVFLLAPPKEIPATDLVLSATQFELKQEEITTASATVYPQDATDKTVVWTSSDEKVATVNNLGTITAVGKGTCVITVKCGSLTKTINVTVKSKIDFKALYETIDADVKYGWTAGSDGSYLSADTNVYDLDDYSNGSIWASIKEMNKTLGLPGSLTEDMNTTTWSMGRQNKVFSSVGIEVTWTYHPDKGMEVTYKLLEE